MINLRSVYRVMYAIYYLVRAGRRRWRPCFGQKKKKLKNRHRRLRHNNNIIYTFTAAAAAAVARFASSAAQAFGFLPARARTQSLRPANRHYTSGSTANTRTVRQHGPFATHVRRRPFVRRIFLKIKQFFPSHTFPPVRTHETRHDTIILSVARFSFGNILLLSALLVNQRNILNTCSRAHDNIIMRLLTATGTPIAENAWSD